MASLAQRAGRWALVGALAASVLAGCGAASSVATGSTTSAPAAAGAPAGTLDAEVVIDATVEAGTARATLEFHGSPTDPGTDHGTFGQHPEDTEMAAEYDFEHDRARLRMELGGPSLEDLGIVGFDEVMSELGGEPSEPAEPDGPTEVEVRVVDDTAYVRDGSWLCPMCGFDDPEEAWPDDKWIVQPELAGKPVGFRPESFDTGFLTWLTVIDDPLERDGSTTVDGEELARYRTALTPSEAEALLDGVELQSDVVEVALAVDGDQRARRLEVTYHADDRDQRYVAVLRDFGTPVEVEVPPVAEQFRPT